MRLPALAAAVAATAMLASAAEAQAPPITIDVDAKVFPNKAGTKKKPQPVKLDVTVNIGMPDAYDPPLVDGLTIWFPKGGKYNGAKHPKCTKNTLARKGPSACPKGSIMGKGSGDAMADDVKTHPKITVVNGGGSRVFFYTTMTNPARVQAPIEGKIRKQSGKYSYRVDAKIPKVLQVVAGVPIKLERVRIKAGKGDWLATTSCPSDKLWRYDSNVEFTNGQNIKHAGTVACR